MADITVVLMYIDPGMGFLALQMSSGILLGGAFYFRRSLTIMLGGIRTRLGLKKSPGIEPNESANDE